MGRCLRERRNSVEVVILNGITQAALLPLAGVEAVSVRREGERFIFGLQTMLGTGEIAVKGAKV